MNSWKAFPQASEEPDFEETWASEVCPESLLSITKCCYHLLQRWQMGKIHLSSNSPKHKIGTMIKWNPGYLTLSKPFSLVSLLLKEFKSRKHRGRFSYRRVQISLLLFASKRTTLQMKKHILNESNCIIKNTRHPIKTCCLNMPVATLSTNDLHAKEPKQLVGSWQIPALLWHAL